MRPVGEPGRAGAADRYARRLTVAWQRHGNIAAGLGIAYLAIAAAGKLRASLPHLLRDVASWSAIDLKYRYGEVSAWFAGGPVYGVVDAAVYPPATHAILWPFMGWVSLTGARVLWAITILAAACALFAVVYQLCAPARTRDRLLVAGLAFAAYPLSEAIFVGQLGMHVAAFAAAGAFLALRETPRAGTDALAGVLLAAALVKPTVALPLVVGVLIAARRARPAVITLTVYLALTLVAAAAQPAGLVDLVRAWLAIASVRVPFAEGVPNLHMLLAGAGLEAWMTPASLTVLAGMSVWLWRRRSADPWLLMGVTAIVARVWAHSTTYDDAFLLLAMVALFRVLYASTGGGRVAGALLITAAWAALLTPTWAIYNFGGGVRMAILWLQTIVWLAVLIYLMRGSRGLSPASSPASTSSSPTASQDRLRRP